MPTQSRAPMLSLEAGRGLLRHWRRARVRVRSRMARTQPSRRPLRAAARCQIARTTTSSLFLRRCEEWNTSFLAALLTGPFKELGVSLTPAAIAGARVLQCPSVAREAGPAPFPRRPGAYEARTDAAAASCNLYYVRASRWPLAKSSYRAVL